MSDYLQVETTVDSHQGARALARALIEGRLAACVQVSGPIESTYRWQGKVETNLEWRCTAKTTRNRYGALEEAIRRLHTYDVPEIIATPIECGSQGYLDWLRSELEEG